jgi:adenosylcobinamide-GDP ribazoletransferase
MSLLAAFAFLTILPLPERWRVESDHLARSVPWFPLAGLGVGIVLAGLDGLAGSLLARPARDALLVVASLVLSGALHLDGLIDTCDGVFAAVRPERRLEIMRDSHVGSFGVAAAGLVLLGKYAALASLGETPRWAALLAMAVLGRWAMSLAVVAFPAGRSDGLGRLVKDATQAAVLAPAGGLALLVCWAALQVAGAVLFLSVSVLVWLAGRALMGRLPGLTGDTYGALEELTELATLALAPVCVVGVGGWGLRIAG